MIGGMNDLHDKTFTNLNVIGVYDIKRYKSPKNEQTKVYWVCECSCGATKIVRGEHLVAGKTISCGCLAKNNATKHGYARSRTIGYAPEYRAWLSMRSRIISPDKHHKKYYSDIGVSKSWDKFERFLADMGNKPTPKHELDRIDPFLPYCKENCRWATRSEQMLNTKRQYTYPTTGGSEIESR